jgi:NADH:ubiquinone oxidoreductase subunit K
MFVVTLAAAAVDSYLGVGLGIITLIALLLSSIAACLLVRRRDLLSVVVAPPLVFFGVALVNIALAPSASFSLPIIATLLIRGFPAMGIAVGVSFVLFLGRLIARR